MALSRCSSLPAENEGILNRADPSGAGHPLPDEKCSGTEHSMARRTHEMSTVAEQIVHSSMKCQEALRMVSGFETPHLALLLTRWLMRHLRSVVRVLARVMVRPGAIPLGQPTDNFSTRRSSDEWVRRPAPLRPYRKNASPPLHHAALAQEHRLRRRLGRPHAIDNRPSPEFE